MKNKIFKKNIKDERAITLIALVITIIVLLILAGISISMLSGDNSILSRATNAKKMTDKSQIVEQARLDILGVIADKSSQDMTDIEIKDILDDYFDEVPSKFTDLSKTITTKDGKYEVKLSEVLDGVKVKTELSVADIKSKPDKFYGSEITN